MKVQAKGKSKPKMKQKYFTCTHCDKQFTNYSSWYTHIQIHTTDYPYHCHLCDYKCKIKKYLTRHVKKRHTKPTSNRCGVCGKCFHYECKLKAHMRVHTGEKPYKCKDCDKAFSSSYSLNSHKLIHSGEKPFHCLYCDYACRDSSTIRKHMERHLGVSKDYPCSICNKNFKKKETLQIHVDEVHFDLDTRKYPCTQCSKIFKTKGTLNTHKNTIHSTTNRVKCEICGVYSTKYNLQAHMRRHIDVKPYKCSYKPCGRLFKDKGDLKRHCLIHYPDSQYQCHICNRRFPRKHRLTQHIALHESKYNVQCDHCGEMFSTKMYLSRHIKKYHGPNSRQYICDKCGMLTNVRRNMVLHLQYGHGTEKDTKCQICKRNFNKNLNLKEHYLKHHNVKYSLMETKKEDEIPIKEEPSDEIEVMNGSSDFLYEIDIQKHEIEDAVAPSSPDQAIDSDTITYSKKVLSEDISKSLIERERTEDVFDDFFIGHVLKKPKVPDLPKQIINKKKEDRVDKRLNRLLSKVRLRRECKALEMLRVQYNRRIINATSTGNKKEQKCIRYFKNPEQNNVPTESQNVTNNDEVNTNDNNENSQRNAQGVVAGEDKVTDDEIVHDDDEKDEDYRNSDEEEVQTIGNIKFNTHQCYICFKLYKTKTELKRHCMNHFDICNEKMLKKCPFCGYVTNLTITRHIKVVHKISIDIPYARIKEKNTQNGSKYVWEIDKDCDLEVIPSISNLNKIASMKIDEKNREDKNVFLGTTKLVKKNGDWLVEKQAVHVNHEYLLPEFSNEEYASLKCIGQNYLERIRNLSILAKKKGLKILYPCEGCEKICLTMSALKLHNRKHEINPKKFKPKIWKNKILNGIGGKYRYVNKNNKKNKELNTINENNNTNKNLETKKRTKLEIITKHNEHETEQIANRYADPNPVRNKHKCDKKLIEFYKKNIKGGDIEFWQFLKIFNKMSRENVNDFKDLENRHDFGLHFTTKDLTDDKIAESNTEIVPKNSVISRKRNLKKKTAFTRAILISKKEYLKRMEIKNQMRLKLKTL